MSACTQFPKIVSVALTTRCNANCVMCWRRAKEKYDADMNIDAYNALLTSLLQLPKETKIFISTGEPTIAPFLADFLMFCARNEFKVILYSNAQKVPKGLSEALQCGLKITFGFSIDGGTEDSLQSIQRGCTLKRALETIKEIRNMSQTINRPKIDINFIANITNIGTLSTLVDTLSSFDIDTIVVSQMKYFPIVNNERLKRECNEYANTDYSALFEDVKVQAASYGINFKTHKDSIIPEDYSCVCLERNSMAIVTVAGDVLLCPGAEKVILGNLRNRTLVELWNSQTRMRVIDALNRKEPLACCKDCALSLRNVDKEYYL